jgi:hypothetical protein
MPTPIIVSLGFTFVVISVASALMGALFAHPAKEAMTTNVSARPAVQDRGDSS